MKADELDPLRATLRRGDPAADGRAPSEEEVRVLRARLLAAAPDPAPPGRRALRPAWTGGLAAAAVALGLTVALAAAWLAGLLPVERPSAPGPEEARYAAPPPDPSEPAGRQIQFTTEGGTRIVWVLYPDDPSTEGRGRRGPGGRS